MHTEPRTQTVRYLVIHTNEGPEYEGAAANLEHELLNNGPDGGGYNVVSDDQGLLEVQPDSTVCWANGAVNEVSLDICAVGYAGQSLGTWESPYDVAMLQHISEWLALKSREYGIPLTHATGGALTDGVSRGVCGHGDLTNAGYTGTEGHWDPGPNFPYQQVLANAQAILTPPAPPCDAACWQSIEAIQDWEQALAAKPLVVGDRGPEVQSLNGWLIANGAEGRVAGDAYSPLTKFYVADFKAKFGLPNRDGAIAGGAIAQALVAHAK